MVNPGYRAIAQHFGYPDSETFCRILENVFSPEEALMVAELPSPLEEIATKLNMETEAVEASLRDLTQKGALVRGSKGYRLSWMVVEFRDLVIQTRSLRPPLLDELSDLWAQFAHERWYRDIATQYAAMKEPPVRVVPAMKAVEHDPDVAPDQDLRQILKGKELIGIGLCPCRRQSSSYRSNRALEVCFLFDRWAAAGIERGAIRRVSYEEALQAASLGEENGLVHTLGATSMCNCSPDYCVMVCPLLQHGLPVTTAWAKSGYESVIHDKICSGCQDCVDSCPSEAIEMVKLEGSRRLKAAVDLEKCIGCGVCFIQCDEGAVILKRAAVTAA
jgi:NAD-dependent dihydropyrimidine dehydrogenase PreA subunit